MKFYTIGYGGVKKFDDFCDLLKHKGVATVVDVRLRPMYANINSFVKAKTADKGIEFRLNQSGLGYTSLVELGNLFVDCADWKERYTQLWEQSGDLLSERLLAIEQHPICLMCSEKKVEACHRQQIADYLVNRNGWTVEHIE